MALNPAGQRPTWEDLSLEIDSGGNLVRVEPRTQESLAGPPNTVEQIAPANLHFPYIDEGEKTVVMVTGGER